LRQEPYRSAAKLKPGIPSRVCSINAIPAGSWRDHDLHFISDPESIIAGGAARMMRILMSTFAAAGVAILCSPSPSGAAEDDFLSRFQGSWAGSGSIQRNAQSSPWRVGCTVDGNPGQNKIDIKGNCRAAVIVQRAIGANLVYDPGSGLYRGVYTGSRVGPARLSGRRNGDVINLTISWPRPVNGDTEARLMIRNEGRGELRITVADNLTPGGPIQQTSNIVLRQR
jgi:hypothetical protein